MIYYIKVLIINEKNLRMELKDFVKESINQIVDGISESKNSLTEKGIDALINPTINSRGVFSRRDGGYRQAQQLEFNVAVTIENKGDSKQGIGVITGLFSAGTSSSETDVSKYATTLKFNIPLSLPFDEPK